MSQLAENSALDRTVNSWGYTTVQHFAIEQAKSILKQKIAYYTSKVDFFHQKYGLDFNEFSMKFNEINNHTLIEKEDDSLIWETSLDVVSSYNEELQELSI
jgi:hypothetical protein